MKSSKEFFKGLNPSERKLLSYGFKRENEEYVLRKSLLGQSLSLIVRISNDDVWTMVYDEAMKEEFIGGFSLIKSEYDEIMEEIRFKCFESKAFGSSQPERIVKRIEKKFKVSPTCPFEGEDATVFRVKSSGKWFGLMMKINYSKFTDSTGEVYVINLKAINGTDSLSRIDGIHPAYHMNKKLWITIPLDDTMDDDTLMKYIEESYRAVENKKKAKKK